MNLLFITSIYPSPLEPTKGVFNHQLVRALALEHDITVISPVSWYLRCRNRQFLRYEKTAVLDGISIHHPHYYYSPKLLRSHYGTFYWHSISSTVRRVIKSRRPDATIGFWVHPDGEAAVRAAREAGVPSMIIAGGSDLLLLTKDKRRSRCVVKVLQAADVLVAVSSDLREKISTLGVSPEKTHVWNRGVDSTLFSPGDRLEARHRLGIPASGRVVVWVGRMVPVKGLDVLIEASSILQRRDANFHLYLVGDGPLRAILEERCRSMGLSSRISFAGNRRHHDLPDWYRAADLTVLPSRSEGLPNVLRESLACGTPFVASRVGGIPEIGQESCRILVTPEDPEALAEAIARGLTDWASVPRMEALTQFATWSESAESLLQILKTCISNSTLTVP